MKKNVPLVKLLEGQPHTLFYVQYTKKGAREIKISAEEVNLPIGEQLFQSKKFDWIALAVKGKPYLLGYGGFDYLELSSKLSGETENRLLKRYSNLYSNEKLKGEGVSLTVELLKDFTQRAGAFLPEKVLVRSVGKGILSMACLENGEYEYVEIEPSEVSLHINIVPVVRLPRNILVKTGGLCDEAKRIWLPRTHGH